MRKDLKEFILKLMQSNGNLKELLEEKLEEVKEIEYRKYKGEEISYIKGQIDLLKVKGDEYQRIMAQGRQESDIRIVGRR